MTREDEKVSQSIEKIPYHRLEGVRQEKKAGVIRCKRTFAKPHLASSVPTLWSSFNSASPRHIWVELGWRFQKRWTHCTCGDVVCVPGAALFHSGPSLHLKAPGQALLGLPERLQHERPLVLPHHPEALRLPLVVSARLADDVAEHVVGRIFFLQAVSVGGQRSQNMSIRHGANSYQDQPSVFRAS